MSTSLRTLHLLGKMSGNPILTCYEYYKQSQSLQNQFQQRVKSPVQEMCQCLLTSGPPNTMPFLTNFSNVITFEGFVIKSFNCSPWNIVVKSVTRITIQVRTSVFFIHAFNHKFRSPGTRSTYVTSQFVKDIFLKPEKL